ncbi:ABC transporter permease [Fructilactobacillus hinvesii]|uniref:ABC transporter permease n=1 Tax=Fructilactobacillus hinvesii TaxID=2940300 RepID=A0ABY5BUA7_9LACO|nr:ABC transporter permease [Fructilactobacillus hinvesii]USS88235.1 ABC transporter permease [Fructilactobacillus hinvesii]
MRIKKIKSISLTSFKALFNNKGRNFLTIIGIIIGIGAVITIMSVGNGLKEKANSFGSSGNADGQVLVQDRNNDINGSSYFTNSDLNLIKSLPGIRKVKKINSDMPVSIKVKIGNKYTDQNATIRNNNEGFEVIKGSEINRSSFDIGSNHILISNKLNKKLKKYSHGQKIIFINQKGYTIDGVFSSNSEADVLIPQKTYIKNYGNNPNQDTINLYINEGFNKDSTLKRVVKTLKTKSINRSTSDFKIVNKNAGMKFLGKIIDYITYFIIFVASISLFIAGIGVMNTMYMTISERSQEIGIRRAFGATKNDIRFQFLLESSMLTLTGGLGGIMLGEGFCYIIGLFAPFKPITSLQAILISVGVSVSIGIIFGIIPANTAARKNLIDIL